jgi:hypothetical protein
MAASLQTVLAAFLSSRLFNWPLIQESKIPRPLSQATASSRPNVFTFTLPLLQGRTGEEWKPSDKMMLSPLALAPHIQVSFTSPVTFQFHLLFCYTHHSLHIHTYIPVTGREGP